ncbi:MAG: glycosyltransferase family 2 protein [Gammaproteobacteria bacterium]|nr:glycosyltransferase family 2 protein [Gammaproteobacteria bacterium]
MSEFIKLFEWTFLIYFILLNTGYIGLNLVAVLQIKRYINLLSSHSLPKSLAEMAPPVSIIVPAYNEEPTIISSIHAMLQLDYDEFELVVVNDGSRDDTLEVMIRQFDLHAFPEAVRRRLETEAIKTVYVSRKYPNLRVVDKVNGGKADALNAGINVCRYPLFCVVDADSILQQDSLRQVVQPFIEDPLTVAAGGTIRISNGCTVERGFLSHVDLSRKPLVLLQIAEYLRAFLFGRMGWAPLNALLIISGAFGVFKKEAVILAGGYRRDTVGEDMELVVRLHRVLRTEGKPYRITFVPDPICWTEAPEDLKGLKSQRIRWQRGLAESLSANWSLLFNPRGGAVGWIAFPYMVIFELLGPFLEVAGYLFFISGAVFGFIDEEAAIIFFVAAIGFGLLLSATALLLEEISFHIYPRFRHTLFLILAATLENFGYRQLNSLWRLQGMIRWMLGHKSSWGEIRRVGHGSPETPVREDKHP